MHPDPYVCADFIYSPPIYNKAIRNIRAYKNFVKRGGRIFDINSPTLEDDVEYCKKNHINYLISIQYDLLKEYI